MTALEIWNGDSRKVIVPRQAVALDGGTYEAFRFRNVPWQSGGDGPEIVK